MTRPEGFAPRRPYVREAFERAVREVVAGIPPGRVMSYGEVARRAGYPRHARMVGRALKRDGSPLPWHRVVRADRSLAFAAGSEPYLAQKRRLEAEGARLVEGRVIEEASGEPPDLDRLLWGPPPE